ncbi:MAG: tagaturonate reductase [Ferruginibacter sp.]|nr:tagaturonate reductase [Ferruginibacter sp.]
MNLSRKNLSGLAASASLTVPGEDIFNLPEKVLQFGTGVLLRGLPDFFIDKANNKGIFNGRILVVKSTNQGGTDAFGNQDGLYTVCVRGIDNGKAVSENHVVSAVSRVLSAANDWEEILLAASNPDMQVVISNTTEVGIALVKDNIHANPPASFPGKLLSFLYHRFKFFHADPAKGMVIIPTELVPDNGDKLLAITLELAHQHGLEISFLDWLENANYFCNSLVDRIVPGKMNDQQQAQIEATLGYKDELMIMSESYALWAIQANHPRVAEILSFVKDERGIIIAPSIGKFRELKLRLLNGSHTFSCGLAFLAGFETVREAMDDLDFSTFIQRLMQQEIIPAMVNDQVTEEEANNFANAVIDRYRNQNIEHKWLSITTQYSSKMALRNIKIICDYDARFSRPATAMSLGFAAHILFMKGTEKTDGKFYGQRNGKEYLINDDHAALYANVWQQHDISAIVKRILSNESLWGTDLDQLHGFSEDVISWLQLLTEQPAANVLKYAVEQINEPVNEK